MFDTLDHFPPIIDSTMLSAYASCPQKFFVEFVLRKSKSGRSIHLHAGGCMAAAFEAYRIAYYRDGLKEPDCLAAAFRVFIARWGDMEVPEHIASYKDFINCWGAIEQYFHYYPCATDYFQPFIKSDGAPAVEFRFAIPTDIRHPITNDPIMFGGRADMLAQNEPTSCYVVDEKTTNALGALWYKQWAMRGQFYGYTFAARWMGFPCAGALVRGIAIQQTQFSFAEHTVLLTDQQLMRWWETTQTRISNMVEMFQRAKETVDRGDQHDIFTRSYGDACSSYGGCQFQELCLEERPWDYYESYETRIWNPLAEDPTAASPNRNDNFAPATMAELMKGM